MLDVAVDAAKKAGDLAYRYFKTHPKVTYKPDNSPVTKADIEVEKLIRKIIAKNFPDHGIIGEELPPVNPKAKYQWIIDPIDGTRDYVRNFPYWAVFVAVLEDKEPLISVVYFPVAQDLLIAQKSEGAFVNSKRVRVSKTQNLKEAYVCFGTIKRFIQFNRIDQLTKICTVARAARSYVNLNLKFFLEGKADVILEPYGAIYDFAAPALLIEEAGGKFTDFDGKFSLTSGNAIATNGLLHNQVIKILNG